MFLKMQAVVGKDLIHEVLVRRDKIATVKPDNDDKGRSFVYVDGLDVPILMCVPFNQLALLLQCVEPEGLITHTPNEKSAIIRAPIEP